MWADETNAAGGICGRKVEITVKDHGYDVQRAVAAYADISPDVVALPQVIGSPVVAALLDDVQRDHLLTFPQAWAASLLGKESVQVVGTTYDLDMIAAVDFLTPRPGRAEGRHHRPRVLRGRLRRQRAGGFLLGGAEGGGEGGRAEDQGDRHRPVRAGLRAAQGGREGDPDQRGARADRVLVGVAASRGLRVPVVSSAPGFAPQLMKTPAAPALAALLHVVSSAPAVSSELPGVRRMVTAYRQKYAGSPVDSGVLSGYNAAQLLGAGLKKRLRRRESRPGGRGEGAPRAGERRHRSGPSRRTSSPTWTVRRACPRTCSPDAKALGGLVGAEEAHRIPGAEET